MVWLINPYTKGTSMTTNGAALIGCSRMGAFVDNEMPPDNHRLPYSHGADIPLVTR
jgi:hypothetical protein